MEDIMNNIENVDTAMEVANEIDMESIPVQVVAEAGLGKGAKVCLGLAAFAVVVAGTVALYRKFKKKHADTECAVIETEIAGQEKNEAIDDDYVYVDSNEE